MRKVLLLSYYWPPAGGPGVQRWLKNVVFLRKYGWDTIVITPENPVASSYDDSLLKEIPSDLEVHHTPARDPFRAYAMLRGKKDKQVSTGGIGLLKPKSKKQQLLNYIRANFFIPDARKGWNPYLLKQARKVLSDGDIDAIISTGPPHSTHLAAKQLKDEFDLPWLADFRDPWVNIFYNSFFPRTKRTKIKDQNLEDLVLKSADRILTVSPGLALEFEDRAQKVEILYNGYDPADLPAPETEKQEFFSLSYTGNFKPNQNVAALWTALAELVVENDQIKEALQIHFVGNIDPGVRESISAFGLNSFVQDHGYQPHHYATKVMVDSSVLIFIVPQTKDNNLILTGKLFEYLGSGTPLLSIAPPEGNAAEIIQECKRGKSLDYKNKEGIKARILELFGNWQKSKGFKVQEDLEPSLKYTREGSTKMLAEILNELND
ncbi:MAG: glycosyltransferase [Croceimicrobium sp.]